MQLKEYQRRVLDEFERFLETSRAEVPTACIKVPTGGGKTFIATCSIKTIFEIMPRRIKIVVWLVPSEAILSQTLAALKNPEHPYRQRLNADFQYRVGVYSKDECLGGENFDRVNVEEQLSILVLSYDSFRGRKESLRSRQANGNLSSFESLPLEKPIEDAAESSLLQSINRLNPAIIVDESHHAKSKLSIEMLKNFNPSLILELTATPRAGSNIISTVTAAELKDEDMVKLPVIVHNLKTRNEVISRAIDLRNQLERAAEDSIRYIRPIVLLQAQPKTSADSETFGRIRQELIERLIPAEQIAIKTAEINELQNVDLMSRECPIRYIITVNALREGWDCPFAYVLASVANKTSEIDVEQIVGRILRLPYSTRTRDRLLNESYVLTSSDDFFSTLDRIVAGLNDCGYGQDECRAFDERQSDEQLELGLIDARPAEVKTKVRTFKVREQFAGDVERLRLPQFVVETRSGEWSGAQFSMFDDKLLLEKERLEFGFELNRAELTAGDWRINEEIFKIDAADATLERAKLSESEQRHFLNAGLTAESKLRRGRQSLIIQLQNIRSLSDKAIYEYVDRLMETLDANLLERLREFPTSFAERVKQLIEERLREHRRKKFFELLGEGRIKCEPRYKMPSTITPSKNIKIARSLYEAEEEMNEPETRLVYELTAASGVKWWHRNISQREFRINGFINHYPDLMVMTRDGAIIFVEAKGEQLYNPESAMRARLGYEWASRAGDRFQYCMIFGVRDDPAGGIWSMDRLLKFVGG